MGKEWMINPFDIMFTTPFTYSFYILLVVTFCTICIFFHNQYLIELKKCENNFKIPW